MCNTSKFTCWKILSGSLVSGHLEWQAGKRPPPYVSVFVYICVCVCASCGWGERGDRNMGDEGSTREGDFKHKFATPLCLLSIFLGTLKRWPTRSIFFTHTWQERNVCSNMPLFNNLGGSRLFVKVVLHQTMPYILQEPALTFRNVLEKSFQKFIKQQCF